MRIYINGFNADFSDNIRLKIENVRLIENYSAIHLSAFLGKEVEIPFDEELYYNELMKRVATSKRKIGVKSVFADTSNTYGGNK